MKYCAYVAKEEKWEGCVGRTGEEGGGKHEIQCLQSEYWQLNWRERGVQPQSAIRLQLPAYAIWHIPQKALSSISILTENAWNMSATAWLKWKQIQAQYYYEGWVMNTKKRLSANNTTPTPSISKTKVIRTLWMWNSRICTGEIVLKKSCDSSQIQPIILAITHWNSVSVECRIYSFIEIFSLKIKSACAPVEDTKYD